MRRCNLRGNVIAGPRRGIEALRSRGNRGEWTYTGGVRRGDFCMSQYILLSRQLFTLDFIK